MALINCPECNEKVSEYSNVCVHCGYPISEKKSKIDNKKLDKQCKKLSGIGKGYVLDYVNENEFRKLERVLKKYFMLAYKKLNSVYYPALRSGQAVGELISQNTIKHTKSYELKLPSYKTFVQIHGEIKLHYTIYEKEEIVLLETISPEDILLEAHYSELAAYK